MTDRSEVQAVLDDFGRAITSGDGRAAAAIWETPALVVGEEVLSVGSPQEVEQFFGEAKEQYNTRGITGTRAEIVRLDWPTPQIAVAQVRWPYLDATGRTVGEEASTYTFRRNASGELKLRVAVMHGAKE